MKFYLKLNDILGNNELLGYELEPTDLESNHNYDHLCDIISKKISVNKTEFTVLSRNGIKLPTNKTIEDGDIYRLCPTVNGGKGGFGSLLRAFGKQITMSTNKDACRDLTGRRIRHVNNEKRIKDYLKNKYEIARQKELKKKEKAEKRKKRLEKLESTHHLFLDPEYDQQKQKIADDLEQALKNAAKLRPKKRKLISTNDIQISENKEFDKENHTVNKLETKETEVESKITKSSHESKPGSSKSLEIIEEKRVAQKSISNNKPSELNKKEKKDKFSDWLGVDNLDVSSEESEEEEKPAKLKKN